MRWVNGRREFEGGSGDGGGIYLIVNLLLLIHTILLLTRWISRGVSMIRGGGRAHSKASTTLGMPIPFCSESVMVARLMKREEFQTRVK